MITIHDDLIERGPDRVPLPWPLTQSENRVLRYLPTHLSAREIADELCLSANTVKTHQRHLYQKLGAHSRHDAVQRARAIGLLVMSSRTP
jgi:LuxR family maltose regulon positive regulatory protein